MKKPLIFALLSCLMLTGCTNPLTDFASKEEIFAFVNDNYEALEQYSYVALQPPDSPVKEIRPYNNGSIQEFNCGSSGITTSAFQVGFYYSKNNMPFSLDDPYGEPLEIKHNIFKFDNTFSFGEAERIRDNWFYYIKYFK